MYAHIYIYIHIPIYKQSMSIVCWDLQAIPSLGLGFRISLKRVQMPKYKICREPVLKSNYSSLSLKEPYLSIPPFWGYLLLGFKPYKHKVGYRKHGVRYERTGRP